MKSKTKRRLYWIWYPLGLVLFIAIIIWHLIGFLLQPLIGINSYLYNWESDRKLKEEIKSAKLFAI